MQITERAYKAQNNIHQILSIIYVLDIDFKTDTSRFTIQSRTIFSCSDAVQGRKPYNTTRLLIRKDYEFKINMNNRSVRRAGNLYNNAYLEKSDHFIKRPIKNE